MTLFTRRRPDTRAGAARHRRLAPADRRAPRLPPLGGHPERLGPRRAAQGQRLAGPRGVALRAPRARPRAASSGSATTSWAPWRSRRTPAAKGPRQPCALGAVRAARRLGAAARLPARRRVRGADPRPPHRPTSPRARSPSSCTGSPAARASTAPCSTPSPCWPRARGTSRSPTRCSSALGAVRQGMPSAARVEELVGDGLRRRSVLAIGVYCALVGEDVRHGLCSR